MAVMVTIGAVTVQRVPSGVPEGRRYVRKLLECTGIDHEEAELIVSELLTNAVDHGGGERIELSVAEDGERVRIEVADGGSGGTPRLQTQAGPDSERGRGLMLVAAIAEAWGVRTHPGRTVVWAEVHPARAEPSG
jgi:anti-sigma regulatory factor (Ser/Thr protein kinase)